MRRLALVPTLIAVFLFPPAAAALGLGEIETQSALNQQLDAEIPLRGVPAEQSDDVVVTLASEEAFQNVGLERAFALTRLDFTVKKRSDGRYYVHVTSSKAIVEPFLSFLVEVDWPGGNLLREYTVLLDPPVFTTEKSDDAGDGGRATAATAEDDGAGMPGEIEREAEPERATGEEVAAEQTGAADQASGESETRAEPASGAADEHGEKPVFLQVEEREERAERAAAERAEAEAEASAQAETEQAASSSGSGSGAAAPDEYGPVKQGDTLWSIASRLKSGDMTVQQMMLALLRYNPEAFGGDNINRLKQGYVLRVPDADEVGSISAQRALARVREQNSMWQQMQDGSGADTTVAASEQSAGQTSASASTAGSGDGELSIVGADEGGASSDESASATGNQDASTSEKLKLAREQLESTRMEKQELESRVKQLEDTVAKMEKLLTVRNERLTALQEELRKLEGRQQEEGASDDEATQDETDVAEADASGETADETAAGSTDGGDKQDETDGGDETVAAADGGSSGGSGSTATGGDGDTSGGATTGDGASGTSETTTASADAGETATDSGGETAETTAESGDSAEGTGTAYVPEGKQATEEDSGPVTTRTQPPEKIWLDKVNDVVAIAAGMVAGLGGGLLASPVGLGGVAALLLLIVGLFALRRRRSAADEGADDDFEPIDLDSDVAPFDAEASGRFEAGGDLEGAGSHAATGDTDEAESALMAEQFDVGSLDEEASSDAETAAGEAAPKPLAGVDDKEAEKDDTVAEADVYLAYGLHQQAEDLLRLALRETPDNTMYHEKLLETLYASGKSDEFIEEAGNFRQQVEGPQSRLWQRVLAMGRDIAPQHELFAEGDTAYSAADVQPSRPGATDIDLDDAGGDFGFDDDRGGGDSSEEDDFSSTMMLDSGEFGAVDGDAGLAGPDDETVPEAAGASAPQEADEDEDLEFDLGDLEGLSGEEEATPAATAGQAPETDDGLDFDLGEPETASEPTQPAAASADDDDFGFDLDLDEGEGTAETGSTSEPAEAPAAATEDEGLDFDFDLDEGSDTTDKQQAASPSEAVAEESAETADDALEIGDLEIGDLDSLDDDSESASATAESPAEPSEPSGPSGDADAFDLSDLDTGGEETTATPAPDTASTDERAGEAMTDDDSGAVDLSDLDAAGGGDADDSFDLDDLGLEGSAETPAGAAGETGDADAEAAPAHARAGTESGDAGSADGAGEDDEFDTMLDLARAYIDMGDPDSAANALEEVASSGNEKQRSEAESLLESVR